MPVADGAYRISRVTANLAWGEYHTSQRGLGEVPRAGRGVAIGDATLKRRYTFREAGADLDRLLGGRMGRIVDSGGLWW